MLLFEWNTISVLLKFFLTKINDKVLTYSNCLTRSLSSQPNKMHSRGGVMNNYQNILLEFQNYSTIINADE